MNRAASTRPACRVAPRCAVFGISRRGRFMRLTAAIVRARGCHCPFKQIDHRPAGRSIEQSARRKGRKMASRARPADAVEKLSRQKFPHCLIMEFPADRKSPLSSPLLTRSVDPASAKRESRTKRAPTVPREFYKISLFVPVKGRRPFAKSELRS